MSHAKLSRRKKLAVWVRDKFKCQLRISEYCIYNLDSNTATVDHTKPQSKGGTDDFDNLKTACSPCNNLKADRENIYLMKPSYVSSKTLNHINNTKGSNVDEIIKRLNRSYRRKKKRSYYEFE